ncbi:MAG: 3'-5' exonuclease [Bacteroidia bacterium]|nr:3'-5' exonuclease [Bacteroidia bacterium]
MTLNLTKPLVVFDLETTGVDVATDRIIDICMIKLMPDGKQEIRKIRINPSKSIPEESSKIHGIYNEDVTNCPTFKEVAQTIVNFIDNADLCGYNSLKFDVPVLIEEFLRAEIIFDMKNRRLIDVQNIFHKMEKRTLKAAYKFYCDKNLINAHDAEADTKATLEVLYAQIERYQNLEIEEEPGKKNIPVKNDMQCLHELSKMNTNLDFAGRIIANEKGEAVFNFGKHKGKKVTDVFLIEPSYYAWMMNGDFPLYTKKILTQIKLNNK